MNPISHYLLAALLTAAIFSQAAEGQSVLHHLVSPGQFSGVDRWAFSADGAGDVDNDGYADVVIGAMQCTNLNQYARVFSGKTGSLLYTIQPCNYSFSVSAAGEVNGDGFA